MVIAGAALLGTGIYCGTKSGTFSDWWDVLKLSEAAGWITAGLLIAGLGLVVFSILLKNVQMLIAGAAMLGAGLIFGAASGAFENWWDVLSLPEVSGWVTTGILLVGIGLVVFGILLKNVPMLLVGAGTLGLGIGFGAESGVLKNWWDTLMLPQVAGWVTTGLLLGGLALTAFGAATGNILMVLGGIALLGAGVLVGSRSGAIGNWWDTLKLPQVSGWVAAALLLGGIALVAIGAATANLPLLIAGLGLLGAGVTIAAIRSTSMSKIPSAPSASVSATSISAESIPALATGAVIPPNREFTAVLGDQKSGNNIEAPESLIRKIVREETQNNSNQSTAVIEVDGQVFGRLSYRLGKKAGNAIGASLVEI